VADFAVPGQIPAAGPLDLVITLTGEQVALTGKGVEISAPHGGVRPGLAEAVDEVRRQRAGVRRNRMQAGYEEMPLVRAGRLLAGSFLPAPVSEELLRVLRLADRAQLPVRVGLAVPIGLAGLPWEALPSPVDGMPLALHPLVRLYRRVEAPVVRPSPGPLRIVVAIAAPDEDGGPVLDYERELRNVITAVRSARQGGAQVRVVPFATPAAIRAELDREPVHVLHVSGHGSPGYLNLEHGDGTAWRVAADEFIDQAVPAGKVPPVIALSACYTDAPADNGSSFAATLCLRGAAAVIATETSVTDRYATAVFARLYGRLTDGREADVVTALADARRDVQHALRASPDQRDQHLATLGEWAVLTVLAASGSLRLVDPEASAQVSPAPRRTQIAGLAARDTGYFVGRRREQRAWPADLLEPSAAGMVICGAGGVGKTTLAAEVTGRLLDADPGRVLVSLSGQLSLEGLFGAITSVLRREVLVRDLADDRLTRAIDVLDRSDLGWQERLAALRENVLSRVPLLVVLDNFEDNLQPGADRPALRDEILAALLAQWVSGPGMSRLLITSRFAFTLPGGAEQALSFRGLGPLSRAETMKLAWSLPSLDRLSQAQLTRVWRLLGGHPRSLEYLDALLGGGSARYSDVTARLAAAIRRRLDSGGLQRWLATRGGLDAALAGTVSLIADDVLLDDLLGQLRQVSPADELLLAASVYREPVDANALLFQVGEPDETVARRSERGAAMAGVSQVLGDAGVSMTAPVDVGSLPRELRALLEPFLAELSRPPVPPFRAAADLPRQIAACQAASLLTVDERAGDARYFVHRWTAAELATQAATQASGQHSQRLALAHRQAGAYWMWRVETWPQDRAGAVHDLLEARHHLIHGGHPEDAAWVTEFACGQLHSWGAWDQEASLIHDTLARLPEDSPQQPRWIHYLGVLAQARGDHDEADRHFRRSLDIYQRLGDQAGIAAISHHLGGLAQTRGSYDEAEREYHRSRNLHEQLGIPLGVSLTEHNRAALARERGDYDEAERRYQRSVDAPERLGDPARVAHSHHERGALAQVRGDLDEAEREYRSALAIREQIADQVGIAAACNNLGALAQHRGNHDDAERYFHRSLEIFERIGDHAGYAMTCYNLGRLAQARGDHDEAERQYQRSLRLSEQLGLRASAAFASSGLGDLAAGRGAAEASLARHLQALRIRLELGVPQVDDSLRSLAAQRAALGPERFAGLLGSAGVDAGLARTIRFVLDAMDTAAADDAGRADDREDKVIALYEQNLAEREQTLGASHPETVITRINLAGAYLSAGRPAEAISQYKRVLRQDQGDAAGERAADQPAIGSEDASAAAIAAHNLGVLLYGQGDQEGARAAFQMAVDSGHPGVAPKAARNLGVLLQEQGDLEGARAAFHLAIDSGDADAAPMAAHNLGFLLQGQGDLDGARAAFRLAVDSGHAAAAPRAAASLGVLLEGQRAAAGEPAPGDGDSGTERGQSRS